jgi:hypothetical protein
LRNLPPLRAWPLAFLFPDSRRRRPQVRRAGPSHAGLRAIGFRHAELLHTRFVREEMIDAIRRRAEPGDEVGFEGVGDRGPPLKGQ